MHERFVLRREKKKLVIKKTALDVKCEKLLYTKKKQQQQKKFYCISHFTLILSVILIVFFLILKKNAFPTNNNIVHKSATKRAHLHIFKSNFYSP